MGHGQVSAGESGIPMSGVFVDGNPQRTVDVNKRNEMRNCMASAGLTPDEINQKVHELYLTNATEFLGSPLTPIQ
jgi:hypothetical protein